MTGALDSFREQWSAIPPALGRSLTRVLLLAGAFELIARGAVSEASLGGLKFEDLELLQAAIPVLVAYLFYDVVALTRQYLEFQEVHDSVIADLRAAPVDAALTRFLQPRQPSILGAVFDHTQGKWSGYLNRIGNSLFWLLILSIILFEVYAYFLQARLDPGPVTVLSGFVTLFFLIYGLAIAAGMPEAGVQERTE